MLELADASGVPESTTRRYITRFDIYFVNDGKVRGRKYHPSGVAVLVRIKGLYDAGSQTDDIMDALAGEFPMTLDSDEKEVAPPPVPPYATSEDAVLLHESMNEVKVKLQESEERIESLIRDRLDQLVDQIELKKQVDELQKEVSELRESKKKGLWQRLKLWGK